MSNAISVSGSFSNQAFDKTAPTRTRLDALIFWGLALYITTVAFEGPVRYVLSHLKIATLLYARDLISASVILTGLVLQRPNFARQKLQLQLLIYLMFTALFGTILLGNAFFSGLFAIKIFATFLFGISAYTSALAYPKQFKYATVFLFCATVIGVLVNKFIIYPWEGESFESAFGATDMSRVWWVAGGERRLAGLTRASPVAAGILGITGVAMLITIKNYWLRILVMVVGAAGIYLTTSKGLVLAFSAVAGLSLFPIKSPLRSFAGKSLATTFFLTGLLAPLISWAANPSFGFFRAMPHMLLSFADRIVNTWPDTLDNFHHWYNWLIGAGLGGVGLPSLFSGKIKNYTVVDNLHLFLMGNFGLIGTALFVLFFVRVFKHAQNQRGLSNAAFAVAVMGLGYGIVTNIADDAFSPIALGLAWGLLSQPEEAHASAE
ncbi:MAG: hypothetical protein EOP38_02150 [Rubrivivax sp.]|nr:MAG: hypothetical protein EOP38_02150 [Rubrivivax sp.]